MRREDDRPHRGSPDGDAPGAAGAPAGSPPSAGAPGAQPPLPGGVTAAELMTVTIARQLRDGETVAVGSVSPIPAGACLLARRRHAPRSRMIILGNADRYPFTGGVQEFYNVALRGRLDVFFSSGAQIDRHGNFNLSAIGDYAHPRVRLPGGRALGVLAFVARRLILFRTEHSRRVFVDRVDFVTAPPLSPPGVYRLGTLSTVVTDLVTFAFDPERGRLRLATLHPGVTLDEAQARTGFPLDAPDPPPATPLPDGEELRLLRGAVREELAAFYPQFAGAQGSAG
jgi:glutaconate CoA-transferase subunit B